MARGHSVIGPQSKEVVTAAKVSLLAGSLEQLPTAAEIRARNETLDVYVCDIEARSGERVLKTLRTIPGRDEVNVIHLRRFAKPELLPKHVRPTVGTGVSGMTNPNLKYNKPSLVTIILAPVGLISVTDLSDLLKPLNLVVCGEPVQIRIAEVPAYAPTSLEHAKKLSENLWPTVFTNTNPFGPHPTLVASNQAKLEGNAGTWMSLARHLGQATLDRGFGIGVGVVFVECVKGVQEVVVGAGDARHIDSQNADCSPGSISTNPARHAVMRALGLLARKRRRVASTILNETAASVRQLPYFDNEKALTPIEERILDKDNLRSEGYLGLDLDVYITHEPCVMCGMALVHSRIGRCIFDQTMPKTGSLSCYDPEAGSDLAKGTNTASPGDQGTHKDNEEPKALGYSLFWRSDLNWRFLAWRFRGRANDLSAAIGEDDHV